MTAKLAKRTGQTIRWSVGVLDTLDGHLPVSAASKMYEVDFRVFCSGLSSSKMWSQNNQKNCNSKKSSITKFSSFWSNLRAAPARETHKEHERKEFKRKADLVLPLNALWSHCSRRSPRRPDGGLKRAGRPKTRPVTVRPVRWQFDFELLHRDSVNLFVF